MAAKMIEEGDDDAATFMGTKKQNSKRTKYIIFAVVLILVLIIIIAVVLAVTLSSKKKPSQGETPTNHSTTPLPIPTIPPGNSGPYKRAVVAADAGKCSEIGRDIMKKNGSAVDAAVACMLCIGINNMHSAGIGGGGFMVVYNRSNKLAEVIDFREEAPGAANMTMYINSSLDSRVGPSASGIPGEVKGFHVAWKKYGRLPWRDLVQPSIDLAKNGVSLNKNTFHAMQSSKAFILKDPGLRELLVNDKGELRKLGETIKNPKLARTLERIRDDPESFYSGDLAKELVRDIQNNGGIITLQDMKNYEAKVKKPLGSTLLSNTWYSVPPPGSGVVMGLILNILKGYNMTSADRKDTNSSILTYHRIAEAFKFAYAYRALLGDEDFVDLADTLKNITNPSFGESLRHKIFDNTTFKNYTYYGDFYSTESGGTSHMSLMAPNGDAVSVTTTINLYFGSKFRSTSTGIIMNNEMDDFATPGKINAFGVEPSPANFIKPRKRPMSSCSPAIFVDKNGDVRMVSGASGGTKITTATSLSVMNYLWFNRTLIQSVRDPRFHHQLMPMYIKTDEVYPMPQAIIDGLRRLGHEVRVMDGFAVVQAVAKEEDGMLYGEADPRKGGWAAGF